MVCFAIVAGCASAPAPEPVAEFAPAPMAEIAPAQPMQAPMAVAPTAADPVAADPVAGPSAVEPMTAAPTPTVELAYARSETLEHRFRSADGKQVQVAFSVSYSATPDDQAAAARNVRNNWDAAAPSARAILETADLFDEQGRADCENRLCERLTALLFPASVEVGRGTIERVIWERLTWK